MATFTLIEINNDHLNELDDNDGVTVGSVLAAICRNIDNAPQLLEHYNLRRSVRVVCQLGNSLPLSKLEDAGVL